MNVILITVFAVCLALWTFFDIRQQIRFNKVYWIVSALGEATDEKIMEYVKYTVTALKNNQKVLNYSIWAANTK